MKLSAELRKMLGLPDTVGEDVADAVLLPALTQLGARAEIGDSLLETSRAECLRVAKLAVIGSGEGTLPEALTNVINGAGHKELTGLTVMYTEEAAKKFPQTCQSCGKQTSGRSSIEGSEAVEQAGGVQKKPLTRPSRTSIF